MVIKIRNMNNTIDILEFGIDIPDNQKHMPGVIVGLFRVKK